mgnify:CR=1 FL=1
MGERKIGLLGATAIGIGGTIGPSMFVILGFAAKFAHSYVYLSLIVAGMLSLIVALNYAELATTFPEMGGGYYYVREAFGGFASYFAGVSLFIGYITYGAVCAIGFGLLLNLLIPIDPILASTVVVILFLAINIRGIEESMKVQLATTAVLICSFLLIIICGLIGKPQVAITDNILSDLGGIMKAAAFLSIAYFGFEPIGVLAGAVRRPGKIIPLGIVISLFTCITLYSLLAYVSAIYVPWDILSKTATPLTLVATRILGFSGYVIITLAGITATLTSLNVSISSGAYVVYSMAKDHYFPDEFAQLHPKYGTPVYALILTGFIAELFILSGMIEYVTHLADFSILIALSLVNLSTVALRRKRGGISRPFKVPLFPWLSIIASILTVILAFLLEPGAIVLWLGMLLAVTMAYLFNILSIERRKFTLSGFLFAVSVFLLLFMQFGLETASESLKIIIGIIEAYIFTQSVIVFIVGILVLFPAQAIISWFKVRRRELIYIPSKRLQEISALIDDILAILLFIFGLLNMVLFYGILHGAIAIVANSPQELRLYEVFILSILVTSGIFESLVGVYLFKRSYAAE